MTTLRVLVADDHTVVREGLKTLLNAQPDMEVVGEAADGLTVCRLAAELLPDVVILDVSMPELNGARATARLRETLPRIKVLAFTFLEDRGSLRSLLEAGVSGYLLKRATGADLVHAVRAVAAGGVYLDPAVAGRLLGGLTRGPRHREALQEGALSEREADVLRLMAQGHSNKEAAIQLRLSVKTVETYKARAMEKLGMHTRAEVVRYALRQGWMEENGNANCNGR